MAALPFVKLTEREFACTGGGEDPLGEPSPSKDGRPLPSTTRMVDILRGTAAPFCCGAYGPKPG